MYETGIIICICVMSVVAQSYYSTAEASTTFKCDCEGHALEQKLRDPSYPTRYEVVVLKNCPTPNRPYAEVLREHNVIIVKELQLYLIPARSRFGAYLLSGLPDTLETLGLTSSGAVLQLEQRTLSRLPRITSLMLNYVYAIEIPEHLESLQLSFTGHRWIPKEALNVKSLMVVSEQEVTVEGYMPNLQFLTVHAPVPCLLRCDVSELNLIAPKLHVIQLGSYFPMPNASAKSLPEAYGSLRRIRLSGVNWNEVPSHLLRGGSNIEVFAAYKNNFVTLPERLFSDTPNLETIDLSKNKLQNLPRGIFSGLTKLHTLKLKSNQLNANVLSAIAPVTSLKNLHLDDNRLGDLCYNELLNSSKLLLNLKNLEKLTLKRTYAIRICEDWVKHLPNLNELRLEGNNIKSIACSDLRGPVTKEWQTLYIFLKDNPIDHANCTKDDVDRDTTQTNRLKILHLQMPSVLKCDSGSYWLSRWLGLVDVIISPAPVGAYDCRKEWEAYDPVMYSEFIVECYGTSIEQHMPVLSVPTLYYSVRFKNCQPPDTSYAEVLRRHNIIIGNELDLNAVPEESRFGPHVLSGLPDSVMTLRISGAGGTLRMEKGALSALPNLVDLMLHYVQADRIPDKLDNLQLSYTGLSSIPREALNVKTLMVVSDDPVQIRGTMPRLQVLSLYAPVQSLFARDAYGLELRAPMLDIIQLGRDFPEPPVDAMSLPEAYRTVRGIILNQLGWSQIPYNFLRGGGNIRYFIAYDNSFTTLPDYLFSSTPNMVTIDLSYNELSYLPRNFSAGLKNLKALILQSNHLTANVIEAIAPLTSLKELYLDENPLGDFCRTGGPMLLNLKKLMVLSLKNTTASQECTNWIRELPKVMKHLLKKEDIPSIACLELRGPILKECYTIL